MDLAFTTDSGRLVCDLLDGTSRAIVTAASADQAAEDLMRALQEARDNGIAECYWHEEAGDYRWIFCRHGDTFDVAVMWCSGVITGWQHVFRADCPVNWLLEAAGGCQTR
jgi:hypothetical protein